MNFYGIGRPMIRRSRGFMVEATCKVRIGFVASGPEDAERQFYDFTSAVENDFPVIVFEDVSEIYEEE
ncbi:MAG: hypothetical protein RR614_07595 [Eubacterium sp.]